MKQLDVLATVLVIVGALNWGLVGLAQFDLVAALFGMRFGETSALTSMVYGLVGLAGFVSGGSIQGHATPLAVSACHPIAISQDNETRMSKTFTRAVVAGAVVPVGI